MVSLYIGSNIDISDEEFFDDSQVMQEEEKWLDEEMSNIQPQEIFIDEDVPF